MLLLPRKRRRLEETRRLSANYTMYRTPAALLCISVVTLLCACGAKQTTMQSRDAQARDADGDAIYQKTAHPKQAYRITMIIEDVPGSFEVVSSKGFYDMTGASRSMLRRRRSPR
ncbi:hypothetical protein VDQ94_04470 [Xanthomonas campestris pv. campestris]|nr:hypothetical protein [Xanthomonas campestris pv. campestris]MEB1551346.1 hypothetical protein [Xanthomonas campestris pv. campestris]